MGCDYQLVCRIFTWVVITWSVVTLLHVAKYGDGAFSMSQWIKTFSELTQLAVTSVLEVAKDGDGELSTLEYYKKMRY